jgi:hypothetical protein
VWRTVSRVGLLLLPLLAALAVLLRRRVRGAPDAGAAAARGALDDFRRQAAAQGTDMSVAFAELLATLLRCPPAAVVSPDLADRLVAAGVPAGLARRTATLLESLVLLRFGGEPRPGVAGEALVLADELAAWFEQRPAPGAAA